MVKVENINNLYVSKEYLLASLHKINFEIIQLKEQFWSDNQQEIYALLDIIFNNNPFYKAITYKVFKANYNKDFVEKLCPYTSVVFKCLKTNKLAAISLCFPQQKIKNLNGNNTTILNQKVLLAKTVGVHPNFRANGLMNYMGVHGMLYFKKYYDAVIFCTMRADNFSLHFTDGIPHEKNYYAMYTKLLF